MTGYSTQSKSNRIVMGMAMQDYLEAPGVSKHGLDAFDKSPAYYRDMMDGKLPEVSKEHLELGRALHSLVLESQTIHVVKPATYTNEKGETKPWNGNSNTCKQWLSDHSESLVLSAEQDEWCASVQGMVLADKRCARIMISGQAELSLFGYDPNLKRALKSRPDWCNPDEGLFADIKTTVDASTDKLSRQIVSYRWHVQAAMVRRCAKLNGIRFDNYYLIAIEKSNPPRLNVRRLSMTAIDRGDELLEKNLKALIACQAEDEWPDYSGPGTGIGLVDIPAYAYNDPEPMELKIQGAGFAL